MFFTSRGELGHVGYIVIGQVLAKRFSRKFGPVRLQLFKKIADSVSTAYSTLKFNPFSAGTVFIRQNLTSVAVRF